MFTRQPKQDQFISKSSSQCKSKEENQTWYESWSQWLSPNPDKDSSDNKHIPHKSSSSSLPPFSSSSHNIRILR